MNFKYLTQENIFLLVVFCIGTFLIYFFSLKREWHELRKRERLVSEDYSTTPKMMEKNTLGQRFFFGPCCRLLVFSAIISLSICLFYITTVPNLIFNSVKDMIGSMFLFIPLWAMFLDVSLKRGAVLSKEDSKVFGHLYGFIAWIKEVILNHTIALEKKKLYETIRDCIKKWYLDWQNNGDLKLGILILRIDENYLEKLVISEEIMGLKREIVLSFGNNGFTLVDLLNRFFTVEVERNGVVFEDVLRFLQLVEITSTNQVKSDLDLKLNECIERAQEYTQLPEDSLDNLESVFDLKKMINHKSVSIDV